MIVTLLLNDPPGGRCRLYRAYAAALAEHAGVCCTESPEGVPIPPGIRAPAILVDGRAVVPADGVIIAPDDLGAVLGSAGHADAGRIVALLEGVMEKQMQDWA